MKKYFTTLLMTICCLFAASAQDLTQVYIIGGACPNGWDNGNAEALTKVEGTEATFTWTGVLSASDFKFINARGSWDHCFHASANDETVILGQTHRIVYDNPDGDFKFRIQAAGKYKVTVDLKGLTMVVESVETMPTEMWITGSAVPNGTAKMVSTASAFRYFGELQEGSVKLMTTPTVTADTKYYVPTSEAIDIVNAGSSMKVTSDATAAGWEVSIADDTYKIAANIVGMSLKGQFYTPWSGVYIVGGCAPCGWDAANAIAFTQDATNPNLYTWSGTLAVNNDNSEGSWFKLLGQQDWGPNNAHPYIGGENILNSTQVYVNTNDNDGGDLKWSIETDGDYEICVDLFNETINARYLGAVGVQNAIGNDLKVIAKNNSIAVETASDIKKVTIFDANGRIVKVVMNTNGLISSNLMSGLYLIKVETETASEVRKAIL